MHTRTYCSKCGTWRYKPEGKLCGHCQRAAEVKARKVEVGQSAPSPVQSMYVHMTFTEQQLGEVA